MYGLLLSISLSFSLSCFFTSGLNIYITYKHFDGSRTKTSEICEILTETMNKKKKAKKIKGQKFDV